jgi:restriction system protein
MAKTMWVVRAGESARFINEFRDNSLVAIGDNQLEPLANITDRQKIIQLVRDAHPEMKEKQALVWGSQVFKFRSEMKMGDRVVTYDPNQREYLVGTISGNYEYDTSIIPEYPRIRKVQWVGSVLRDDLSAATKNTLGAISTLFNPSKEAAEEIELLLSGKKITESQIDRVDEEEDQKFLLKDMQARSHEFIKDKVSKLDWEEMQELVAGVLRAMGYKTKVSPAGPDQGKDIVASPDGFGFESPRIIVEVKHRKGQMGSQQIRSFLGGRHKDDKGLYVSTGGFSKDAKYEAERANIPLTLMNLDDLVQAIIEHYESMDLGTRVLVPLSKVYWPSN